MDGRQSRAASEQPATAPIERKSWKASLSFLICPSSFLVLIAFIVPGCLAPTTGALFQRTVSPASGPKLIPKASTCVAYASFREKEAIDPRTPPDQRHTMLEQARVAYEQALQVDPKYGPASFGLARVYGLLGDEDHALTTYQIATRDHPNDPSVWYELGMWHARRKEWDHACENLDKAVQRGQGNREYATALGYCLARAGRFRESIVIFTALVGKAEAYCKMARMARHLKRDDLCKEFLQQALLEQPNLTKARGLLQQVEFETQPPRQKSE